MIALRKSELFQAAVSLLYPATCTICGKQVRAGEYLCDGCEAKVLRIVPPFCETCSEPFEGSINTAFSCANCAHRTIYFDTAVAAYRGRGIVRDVIHEFKYNRQTHLRHLVGRWLCAALDDERLRNHQFEILCQCRYIRRGNGNVALTKLVCLRNCSARTRLFLAGPCSNVFAIPPRKPRS